MTIAARSVRDILPAGCWSSGRSTGRQASCYLSQRQAIALINITGPCHRVAVLEQPREKPSGVFGGPGPTANCHPVSR
ncbi:MAG: hypothetical protein ACR2NP_10785, partial [Pirellulaceae bacterium]